jgi:hypothetical protein
MSKEKYFEKKLRERVEKLKGFALKFSSSYFTGIPDRIVLMPGGKLFFVEVKDEGVVPKDRQKLVIYLLQEKGFDVSVINSNDSLFDFLQKIEK